MIPLPVDMLESRSYGSDFSMDVWLIESKATV